MSLIDEALKRAQAADRLSPSAPYVGAPTHMPDRRPRWTIRALWLTGGLLVLTSGVWVATHRGSERPAAKSSEKKQPLATEVIARTTSPLPKAPNASVSAMGPEPSAATTGAPIQPARAFIPEAARPDVRTAEKRATPASATIVERPPSALVDGKSYSGEILLAGGAKIELDGIVYSEESPVALINSRIVAPGASIEGMTVAKIEPDRVTLEGHGVTVFLLLK